MIITNSLPTSAKPIVCAHCGGNIGNGPGSVIAVIGSDSYHLACTPDQIEKAHWLYHSEECPTCKGKGRISIKP